MFESLLHSIFWGRYSEVELLEHMVIAFLIFQGPATLFSRPFFQNLSFVPRSASLPPLWLLLLCLHFCPLSLAHQGSFFSLSKRLALLWPWQHPPFRSPFPSRVPAQPLAISFLPQPLPQTFPCGSGFHPPININIQDSLLVWAWTLSLSCIWCPSQEAAVGTQPELGEAGWRAQDAPLCAAGILLEEQARASLGTYTFPPMSPGWENMWAGPRGPSQASD